MRTQAFLQSTKLVSSWMNICFGSLVIERCKDGCHFWPQNLTPTIEDIVGAQYGYGGNVVHKFLQLDGFLAEFMQRCKPCLVVLGYISSVRSDLKWCNSHCVVGLVRFKMAVHDMNNE